jgi:cytochrome c
MRKPTSLVVSVVAMTGVVSALLAASSSSWAAGDPAVGRQVFARCAICHSNVPGENKVGPSLAGVFGRKAGSEPGYSYSLALKSTNITWDEHTLNQFLTNPGADVHGTKMFLSVPNMADRENLIAYLQTLK